MLHSSGACCHCSADCCLLYGGLPMPQECVESFQQLAAECEAAGWSEMAGMCRVGGCTLRTGAQETGSVQAQLQRLLPQHASQRRIQPPLPCLPAGKHQICHQPPGRCGEVGSLSAPQRDPEPPQHARGGGRHCGGHNPQVVIPCASDEARLAIPVLLLLHCAYLGPADLQQGGRQRQQQAAAPYRDACSAGYNVNSPAKATGVMPLGGARLASPPAPSIYTNRSL